MEHELPVILTVAKFQSIRSNINNDNHKQTGIEYIKESFLKQNKQKLVNIPLAHLLSCSETDTNRDRIKAERWKVEGVLPHKS